MKNDSLVPLENFKKIILISFTKNLIQAAKKQEQIKERQTPEFQTLKSKIKIPKRNVVVNLPNPKGLDFQYKILNLPKPKIPENFNILKQKIQKTKLNISKIDNFLQNKNTKAIELKEENTPLIIINQEGKEEKTNTHLDKNEIEKILKTFEEKTNNPIKEGIYKTQLNNLIFTAIISEILGTKFIIQKI